MAFDPSQPFDVVDEPQAKPAFNPAKPFEPVAEQTAPKPAFDPAQPFDAVAEPAQGPTDYHTDAAIPMQDRVAGIRRQMAGAEPQPGGSFTDAAGRVASAVPGMAWDFLSAVPRTAFKAAETATYGIKGAITGNQDDRDEAERLSTETLSSAQLGASHGFESIYDVGRRAVSAAANVAQGHQPFKDFMGHRYVATKQNADASDDEIKDYLSHLDAKAEMDRELASGHYAAGGIVPKANLTPEQLAARGHAIDDESVQKGGMATLADPVMYAPGIGVPGANAVAGGALKYGGGAVERLAGGTANAAARILDSKLTRHLTGEAAILDAVVTGGAHLPVVAAGVAGTGVTWAGAKMAENFARLARQSGEELLGAAAPTDRGLFGIIGSELFKGATHGGINMAPFALSANSPEEAASTIVTGATLGGLFRLAETSPRGSQGQAWFSRLAKHGEAESYGPDVDAQHAAATRNLDPLSRQHINALKGFFAGQTTPDGKPIQINPLTAAEFVAKHRQESSGIFDPDTGHLDINIESGRSVADIMAHEGKHAMDAALHAAQPQLYSDVFGSLKKQFTVNGDGQTATPEFLGWIQGQMQLHMNNLQAAGASAEQINDAMTKLGGMDYWLNEASADIGQGLITGGNLGEYMMPPGMIGKITNAVMDVASKAGVRIAPGALGLPGAGAAVRQIRRQLYTQGAEARAKMESGPSAQQEIYRLQKEHAAIPPFNAHGSAKTEQDNARKRAEIERDLNRWQRRAAGETVPEDAAPEGQPAEGQPAAPAPGSPQAAAQMRQAVAEQMKAEGIKNPHPQINEALKRNEALASPEDLLAYVKALEAEKEAIAAARTLLVTPAYNFTATEAKQWTDAVVTAHGDPVTDAQKLVLAAARLKREGKVERGEFNRPDKPEVPSGGIAPFNDHQGQTHTVTGQTDRPAQPGDFILTRQGVRRVVKPTVDGHGVETVGTFVGDTTTTAPVQHGTYAVLETTAAPKAAPSSPAQGSAPKPAPAPPPPAAGEPIPPAIPALDAAPGAGTPEPEVPELRAIPYVTKEGKVTDRWVVVDRADNPISKTTYGKEADAQQAIARQGKGIKLGNGPGGAPDLLNLILDELGGIAPKKPTQENDDRPTLPSALIGTSTPEDVARGLHDNHNISDGSVNGPNGLWENVRQALKGRDQGKVQDAKAAEEAAKRKAAEQAGQSAWEKLPQTIQDKLADDPSGDTLTTAEKQAVNAAIPGTFKITPQEAAQARIDKPNEPAPEPPTGEPVPPRTGTAVAEPPAADDPARPPAVRQLSVKDIDAAHQEGEMAARLDPDNQRKKGGGLTAAGEKKVAAAGAKAAAKAHAETVPANYAGITERTDPIDPTAKTIEGNIRAGRPFDNYLIKLAGLSSKAKSWVAHIADRLGQPLAVRYLHAEGEGWVEGTEGGINNAATRRARQGHKTTEERAARAEAVSQDPDKGQIETKVIVPDGFKFNPGKRSITITGRNPEKMRANFSRAEKEVRSLGERVPYEGENDPQIDADIAGLEANNSNGYTWDGRPLDDLGTGLVPRPVAGYRPYRGFFDENGKPDVHRFEFLNLIMGDESARLGAEGMTDAKEAKLALAIKNRGPEGARVNATTGETNSLRERINERVGPVPAYTVAEDGKTLIPDTYKRGERAGQPKTTRWSTAEMENALSESIRVDLIENILNEVPKGQVSPLHTHGRTEAITPDGFGRLNRTAAAGRFMPEDTSPQGRAKKRMEERLGETPRNSILSQYRNRKIKADLGESRETIAIWKMMDTLNVPEGWTVKDTIPSGYGSAYWELRTPDDERVKISIRDHAPSPIRAKQFGGLDEYVMVGDSKNPQQFADAMTEMEERLKTHLADKDERISAAAKKAQEERLPKLEKDIERTKKNLESFRAIADSPNAKVVIPILERELAKLVKSRDEELGSGIPERGRVAAGFMPEDTSPQQKAKARQRDRDYLAAVNSGNTAEQQRHVDERLAEAGAMWHGTPSGDLRGGTTGLHVGTKRAATEALEARIGIPADGQGWDGTREYGETLLAGHDRVASGQFGKYRNSGYNSDSPKQDFYAKDHKFPTVGDSVPVDPKWKPWIRPVLIVGEMASRKKTDSAANSSMGRLLKKGEAKEGFYYKNIGEDSGSVSAVMPSGDHVRVKLADPITRDDQGRVIPLSERFNQKSNDIRFLPEEDTSPKARAKERIRARLTPYNAAQDARREKIDTASLNRSAEAVRVMRQDESGGYDIAAKIDGQWEPLAKDVPHDRLADYIGARAADVPPGTTTKVLAREAGKSFMPEEDTSPKAAIEREMALPMWKDQISDKLKSRSAWITPDGKWINIFEHSDAMPFYQLNGKRKQVTVEDMNAAGYGRVTKEMDGKLALEHPNPTRKQIRETKDSAIELGLEYIHDTARQSRDFMPEDASAPKTTQERAKERLTGTPGAQRPDPREAAKARTEGRSFMPEGRIGQDPDKYEGNAPDVDWNATDVPAGVWTKDSVAKFLGAKPDKHIYRAMIDLGDLKPERAEQTAAAEIRKGEAEPEQQYLDDAEDMLKRYTDAESLKADPWHSNKFEEWKDELPWNPEDGYDESDVKSLAKEMQARSEETSYPDEELSFRSQQSKGFPPIVVTREKDGTLTVNDGNHRTDHWQQNDYDLAPAWVNDEMSRSSIEATIPAERAEATGNPAPGIEAARSVMERKGKNGHRTPLPEDGMTPVFKAPKFMPEERVDPSTLEKEDFLSSADYHQAINDFYKKRGALLTTVTQPYRTLVHGNFDTEAQAAKYLESERTSLDGKKEWENLILNDHPERQKDGKWGIYSTHEKIQKSPTPGASSKTIPFESPMELKPGMWRISQWKGAYGTEIEELVSIDPRKLQPNERMVETNEEGRGDDSRRYEEWSKQGKTPPPIEVVQTDKGSLKVVDGHRRYYAALRAGKPVLAWISWSMDHPEGSRAYAADGNGPIIRVGLTKDAANTHGLKKLNVNSATDYNATGKLHPAPEDALRVLPDAEPAPTADDTVAEAYKAHQSAAKALREAQEAGTTGPKLAAAKRIAGNAQEALEEAERKFFIDKSHPAPGGRQFMPSDHEDAITDAAIRMHDTGEIFTGWGHVAAMGDAEKRYPDIFETGGPTFDQGFVTKTGTFLSRQEAQEHAKAIGQVAKTAKVGLNANASALESGRFHDAARFMPESEYPHAADEVDGREVINADNIPNRGSISASLDDYEVLKGIREVPMSDFELSGTHYSVRGSDRINELARQIDESKTITPLIVVIGEPAGPYILEGATRAESLFKIGAKSFPALVVRDTSFMPEPDATRRAPATASPRPDVRAAAKARIMARTPQDDRKKRELLAR